MLHGKFDVIIPKNIPAVPEIANSKIPFFLQLRSMTKAIILTIPNTPFNMDNGIAESG